MKKQIKIAFAALACVCTLAACRGKEVTAAEARDGIKELTLEKAQEKYTKGKVSVKVTINKASGDDAKKDAEDIKEAAKKADGQEISKDEMAFYFVSGAIDDSGLSNLVGETKYYLNGTALTVVGEYSMSVGGNSMAIKGETRYNKEGLETYEKSVSERKTDGYELKYTVVSKISWSK